MKKHSKFLRRLTALALVLCMLAALTAEIFAADIIGSGYCGAEGDGKNLLWSLDSAGTFTIKGTGKMKDYTGSDAPWYSARNRIKRLVLGTGITSIGDYAFNNCTKLTGSLIIPAGVARIGKGSFFSCSKLNSLTLPESITSIGWGAFGSCSGFTGSLILPNGIIDIGGSAFAHCRGFSGSLSIPDSVTSIGESAFYGCSGFTGNLRIPDSIISIEDNVFYECTGFNGQLIIPDSVTSIGYSAFYGCSGFTGNLKIPNSVTSIRGGSFRGCSGFSGRLTIPNSVTSIEWYAFSGCTGFTGNLAIPDSVTKIECGAFMDCTGLDGIYFFGDAPYIDLYDEFEPLPFPTGISLYYMLGKKGWIDSSVYDASTETWHGYKLSLWDSESTFEFEMLDFGNSKINGKGSATVFYRMRDVFGKPAPGVIIIYEVYSGDKSNIVMTMSDENGIFGVRTPEIEKDTVFSVKFTRVGTNTAYVGEEKRIEAKVKPLSYEQSWRGLVKAEGSAGLSGGAGISLGVTEFEATLGGASLKYGNAIAVELKESVDDGKVSREMLCTVDESVGPQFKSGIDAAVCKDIQVTAVGVSASAVVSKARTYGLYLENYDPLDSDQLLRTGKFILLCSYLPMRYSVLIDALMKKIDMGANEYTSTAKIALKAGASIGEVKIGSSDSAQAGGTVLASDCARSYTYAIENKMYAPILKRTCETKFEAGFGYGENLSSGTASMSGYIYGDRVSNSQKFSMTMDTQKNKLKEIAYTRFCGDEKSLIWDKLTNDSFVTVAYQDEEAERFLASANMKAYSNGDLMSADVNDAIKIAEELQARGTAAEFNRMKQGIEFDVPFGVELGAKIKLGFGFSGEEAYTYPKKTATVYEGVVYETTESSATPQDVAEKKISLGAYIMTPVEAAIKELWESMKSAADSVVKGVKNGWAKVKGTVKGWFAEISVLEESDDKHESFAILSIMDETESIDDAVIAVTIGEPYAVAVYTDENKTQLVSDELLEENPITITLQYTDDMLSAAGANQASDIRIYRFDTAKNVYVCCMDSVKNTAEKTVTAKVTKQGEFILGVDTAGPLVSDVMLSNQTLTPTISAKVTDMSGIGSFSFWMDENADKPLVTDATLSEHYNEQTGVFTYTFEQPLTKGEHTAYFLASDSLGNKMSRPVTYQFTVSGLDVTFAELSIPDTVNSDTEKLHVQARTEENSAVSEMLVSIKNKDGTGSSYPMTLSGGVWYADIEVSSGNRTITVSLTAADKNGNVVRTEGKAVQVISSDSQKIQMEVLKAERYAGVTEITCNVSNNSKAALTGLLAAASYDSNGRMLSYGEIGAGVNAASKKTFTFDIKTPKNAVKVKLFLLDITHGSKPICAAAEGMIR